MAGLSAKQSSVPVPFDVRFALNLGEARHLTNLAKSLFRPVDLSTKFSGPGPLSKGGHHDARETVQSGSS